MAKKLALDDGIIELEINSNGILRFNPSDFNLYQRFCKLVQELPELEKKYKEGIKDIPAGNVDIALAGAELDRAMQIDAEIKARLSSVFGGENDFDALMGGVNLMACGKNGERVITNLLEALAPYLEEGAHKHMSDAAGEAVAEAKKNRAQRRAGK
ncbi:hypothetical protein [Oscillibacter sp. GMB15532]|uniref:hypothetical protein n=1 Tax=Oscillibacter sp. GMB15532 TaxID=3230022 RepID=UPI0034DF72AF